MIQPLASIYIYKFRQPAARSILDPNIFKLNDSSIAYKDLLIILQAEIVHLRN